MSNKKVFVVGGGTGGHFFPAIALAKKLQEYNIDTFVITDKRCKKYITDDFSLPVHFIASDYFKKNIFFKIKAIFIILLGIFQSIFLLLKYKPKMVVGFGGYPTIPMLFAATILRYPIALHDQNSYFGKANHLFAKYSKIIALSFKDTYNLDPAFSDKTIITGNPVRDHIYNLKITRDFNKKPLKIFVYGGSQSAVFFNNLLPNTLKIIKNKDPELKIEITQQANQNDHKKLKNVYKKLKVKATIQDFFHDMDKQFKKHHLCISRAGASTIAEFIATGMPSILIPYPFSANDHQIYNATHLVKQKAAFMFKQDSISPELLADKIIKLVKNPDILEKTMNNLLKLKSDSTSIFAKAIEDSLST